MYGSFHLLKKVSGRINKELLIAAVFFGGVAIMVEETTFILYNLPKLISWAELFNQEY